MNSIDTDRVFDGTAFEYVIGTLRGDERRHFSQQLQRDTKLQNEVRFWEEQLLSLNADYPPVNPLPATWAMTERKIKQSGGVSGSSIRFSWARFNWSWPAAAVASLLMMVLVAALFLRPPSGINADYIAVLADDAGAARLTAITQHGGGTLWLQWDDTEIPEQVSFQLWAVSERDGQSRSLAVFEGGKPATLALDETTLRLIRDSSHLVLTEEELGGSAIDEPSDLVIAKGECVRLQNPS